MYVRGKSGVAADISNVQRHTTRNVVVCGVDVEDKVLRYVGLDIHKPHYFRDRATEWCFGDVSALSVQEVPVCRRLCCRPVVLALGEQCPVLGMSVFDYVVSPRNTYTFRTQNCCTPSRCSKHPLGGNGLRGSEQQAGGQDCALHRHGSPIGPEDRRTAQDRKATCSNNLVG
jgi:hypothetical protein